MEYALPAGMFAGVLFFFWGISTMLSGGGAGSVEERMARYAGGKSDVKTAGGRREARQRNLVDPFATLSSDVQDKRFQIRVQRDLARANLKLRVAEYYGIRVGLAVGLGLLLGLLDRKSTRLNSSHITISYAVFCLKKKKKPKKITKKTEKKQTKNTSY